MKMYRDFTIVSLTVVNFIFSGNAVDLDYTKYFILED